MKKRKTLEARRRREGYILVAPFVLGAAIFFIGPLISSIIYAFSEVTITSGGVATKFVGLDNFKFALTVNPQYSAYLPVSLANMFTQIPLILALSLVLAVVLNQKFYGRTAARAIFFLPVIIASSVVMDVIGDKAMGAELLTVSSGDSYNYGGLIDFAEIISKLDLPTQIGTLLTKYLAGVFGIIWSCGIQTILFLGGLQSIPQSLYEVSKIEGATKWEEFWFITIPMLRNIISLVLVYSMIDNLTSATNPIMKIAYSIMSEKQVYDQSSAMLWLYFVIILGVIGIVLALYQRLCVKKWD